MNKVHQKHTKIKKPDLGQFGRNEWAILGTTCGEIQNLAKAISNSISHKTNIAYVDADHQSSDNNSNLENSAIAYGNVLEHIDKIDFLRYDIAGAQNEFVRRIYFNNSDLILVNGNHFIANQQIVVLDPRKSLEKKLDRLSNVKLILMHPDTNEVPLFIRNHFENKSLPTFSIRETNLIADFILSQSKIPKINGLVLAGGRSQRMKRDKTKIEYHGLAQRDHMYGLMSELVSKCFFSIRDDQADEYVKKQVIKDRFTELGPYGAILSAMAHDPDSAWLVTASDQPFITKKTLNELVSKRNSSKLATTFYNPETGFPEPLITLWEPRAYPVMLNFLSQGLSCPRKVLINSDIKMIKLDDASVLKNVNTPEEYKKAITALG